MAANDHQEGGDHYAILGQVQHWDWAKNIPYLEGNATKYIGRHWKKGGVEDIRKALHYIQKIVETHYPEYHFAYALDTTMQNTGRQGIPSPSLDAGKRY